jgi:polysaccharide biosynthesis protein PslA
MSEQRLQTLMFRTDLVTDTVSFVPNLRGKFARSPLPAILWACFVALVDGALAAGVSLALGSAHGIPLASPDQRLALIGALLAMILAALGGSYAARVRFAVRRQMALMIAGAVSAALLIALTVAALDASGRIDPARALGLFAAGCVAVVAGRAATARMAARVFGPRFAPRTVVVAGGAGGARLVSFLRSNSPRDARLIGFVDDRPALALAHEDLPFIGPVETLFAMIRRDEVDQVILALSAAEEDRALELMRRLADHPVAVRLAPEAITYKAADADSTDLGGLKLLHVIERPISGGHHIVKRLLDVAFALPVLVISAPVMAMIAAAIRIESTGPVLFRQLRTGYNGREFEILKFRTMHVQAPEPGGICQAKRGDPRLSRVGAWLRRTSLDELPQLVNVLRGDMSLVGPRPHAQGTRAGGRPFEQVARGYAARHRVRPGLTGLAQVRGHRGETDTEDKLIRRVESDLEYIDTWSLWRDLRILTQTLLCVVSMKNAY